jgi:hypothetical protein
MIVTVCLRGAKLAFSSTKNTTDHKEHNVNDFRINSSCALRYCYALHKVYFNLALKKETVCFHASSAEVLS